MDIIEGGIFMVTVRITGMRNGADYLKEVGKIGAHFKLKMFGALSQNKKDKLFAEALSRKFIQIANAVSLFNGAIFTKNEDGTISVTRTISVKVEGVLKDKNKESKRTLPLKVDILKLSNSRIENGNLAFSMDMATTSVTKEQLLTQVNTNLLNDMKSFKLNISSEEMDVLNKLVQLSFWQNNLPRIKCKDMDSDLLEVFIDVLNQRNLTSLKLGVISNLKFLYYSAERDFPLFKNLSIMKQVEILDKGYRLYYTRREDRRDIHLLAKSVYEEMAKIGLHKKVRINGKIHTYLSENKGGRNMLYEYEVRKGIKLKNYLVPFDLWNMLTSTRAGNGMDDK